MLHLCFSKGEGSGNMVVASHDDSVGLCRWPGSRRALQGVDGCQLLVIGHRLAEAGCDCTVLVTCVKQWGRLIISSSLHALSRHLPLGSNAVQCRSVWQEMRRV